ncbi:hypothetical protein BCR43DRAFT_417458, partial [Syncephalastrum racemosum]
LLAVADTHSRLLGYRWHPGKCVVVKSSPDNPDASFRLYGQVLASVEVFNYLGLPFTCHGLDEKRLLNERVTKATGVMAILRSLGIHQYGMGLWAALRAYRTFVRPVLEYGLALFPWQHQHRTLMNKAQQGCVKMTLNQSSARRLPTIVPLVLADLPSMSLRSRILQLKFTTRAHALPVSTLLRNVLLSFVRNGALAAPWRLLTKRNYLWVEYAEILELPAADRPRHPLHHVIANHRHEELLQRRTRFSSVMRMRPRRLIDPVLYLPVSSRDRHRLVKWRMHWLP